MQIAIQYALQEAERFDIICAKGGGCMRAMHELELANCILQDVLKKERERLYQAFCKKPYCKGRVRRQGKNYRKSSTENDYSNYFWLEFNIEGSMYWVTLFYNDIDENSGNPHTQFGRIQFWKVNLNEGAVNTPHRKSGGKWEFCKGQASSYSVWIDDENYDPKEVVEAFKIFVNESKDSNDRREKP